MQYPRSDFYTPGENDNCEALAPFVMSLFDGEADEFEAKQARAHLLICQTCAHRWLDWNRSRDLLQSVSVPAPPPTLLWRVLMACRLAAFSTKTKAPAKSSTNFNGAPTDLSAQILARTTRTAAPLPNQTSSVTKWRSLSLPALAVPAMALWLLVLQRDTFIATLPSETPALSENGIYDREEVAPAPPVRRAASRRLISAAPRKVPLKVLPLRVVVPPESQPEDDPEAEVTRVVKPQEERESPLRTMAWSRRTENTSRPVEDEPRLPQAESAPIRAFKESAPTIRLATLDVPVAAPKTKAPEPKIVKVALATATPEASTRRRLARVVLRPATLSDDDSVPSLRTARWKRVAPNTPHLVPVSAPAPAQVMRVSLPTTVAPAPTPMRLLAENFEGDDGRVEEMRSVVDDFRATLAPDSSMSAEGDEDFSRN